MNPPDSQVPSQTRMVAIRCPFCPMVCSPKRKRPRKADSRKKAKAPSIASVDRKSTRLNSSHTVIYTLSLHDALPICRDQVPFLSDGLLTKEKEAQESRFQEESEGTFHCQRLRDDAARVRRKERPVGAELEFHRNACDYPKNKRDSKNLAPEMHSSIVAFILAHQVQYFEDDQQQCQPHRELWEQVMVAYRKGELDARQYRRYAHILFLFRFIYALSQGHPALSSYIHFAQGDSARTEH